MVQSLRSKLSQPMASLTAARISPAGRCMPDMEMNVAKAFNPYVAFRYTQGDDEASDNDVEGWVGLPISVASPV